MIADKKALREKVCGYILSQGSVLLVSPMKFCQANMDKKMNVLGDALSP